MITDKPIVAHIRDAFFNRSETFIYHLAANLKNFHSIYLADRYIHLDQFPVSRSDQFYTVGKPYSWDWFATKILRKHYGIEHAFEKTIRKTNAGILHAHFGTTGVWALRAKKRLNVPLVTSFYGFDASKIAQLQEWRDFYTTLFQGGDLFLAEGPSLKAKLTALGCPEEKIKIQKIGIPVKKIIFKPRVPKSPGEKAILVFAGRFEGKKGLMHALRAVKEARKGNDRFEFRIIGDGPLRPGVERYIEENKMGLYVNMLGFLPYEDYINELQRADIFIHPSVTAHDGDSEGGAPTTILEAQAAGMPVISTKHADIPSIVVPGKSALLSEEKDIEALTRNIIYLLDHQGQWEAMGRCGRAFVEKEHDISRAVDNLEGLYRLARGIQ